MNLQQMRDFVRLQLDLDDTDLPDVLLDNYLQEGYDRTLELESRWPFFEASWQLDVPTAPGVTLMPEDARYVEMLVRPDGYLLTRITSRMAVLSFGPNSGSGDPVYWSRLNRAIHVHPVPATPMTLTLIGYRQGDDWQSQGASSDCDCDRRLHLPICWYACSLGYAQQEDEVLEGTYMNRFKDSASQARDAIMKPNQAAPKQVAYTHYPPQPTGPGGPARLVFETP